MEEEVTDSAFEVPAAVLCAFCGRSDCPGCFAQDGEPHSGVVAIVPWERPEGGAWSRLWATANAATRGAETFFAAIPDGPVRPALRFAVFAESVAVVSLLLALCALAAAALPRLALEVVLDPGLRHAALRWILVGTPAVVVWMVLAHGLHAVAVEAAARRRGGRPCRRRAWRFGLYACGWDLMTGPVGFAGTLLTAGWRAAAQLCWLSLAVPGMASLCFARGVCALPEPAARRARRWGSAAGTLLAVVTALAVGVLASL
ncbi:MAG: hypothetical protein HY744_34395 [Deltaproteobacteria bacterium]|nr:hypothetical protein [Deltaproteobacteria bacterium]